MLLENIGEYATKVEGFRVVKPEALLILKQAAEANRSSTEKGLKDRIDIMDLLLKCDINFVEYNNLTEKEKLNNFKRRLLDIVTKFDEPKYIDLNPRQFKLRKEEVIKKLKKAV